MKRLVLFTAVAALTAPAVLADFSYEQTSKMTGGAMMTMMKVAGAFNKQLREPMHSSVFIKGDRMAHISANTAQIIDLSKETITSIDMQKKTYSVVTFAQMAEALKQMEAKMKEKKDPNQPEMNFKADIKNTGQTRQIQGFETKQAILTLEMEMTNEKGQKGAMRVISDMWLAPNIAGYDEVKRFQQRMAEKLNWTPGGNMFTQGRSDFGKAFADLNKEGAKLEGVPVLQITKIGGSGDAAAAGGAQPQQAQPAQAQERPSIGGAVAGGALGRLGRFGGLGRKKKEEQPAPEAQPQQTQTASAAPAGGAPSLMEMETESSAFSSAAVDGSKFEIPAGFKQVDSEMLKQMRK